MIKIVLSAAVVFLLALPAARADMFEPSHMCTKPIKPFQFTSQWEVDNFKDEVRRYKECISDFVDEQNEAVRNHQAAAQQAISDWNDFVSYELN